MKDFHSRFAIPVDQSAERTRFVNRVDNKLFSLVDHGKTKETREIRIHIANVLGEVYYDHLQINRYTNNEFLKTLQAVEAYISCMKDLAGPSMDEAVEQTINEIMALSSVDIGVRYSNGLFFPSGAKILDSELVNENLKWLQNAGLLDSKNSFEKALTHLMESAKNPKLLNDVITDAYESVESAAKQVTGKRKDLSGMKDSLVKDLRLTKEFSELFRAIIDYGCKYRHGIEKGSSRSTPKYNEAEAFVYQCGVLLRLLSTLSKH